MVGRVYDRRKVEDVVWSKQLQREYDIQAKLQSFIYVMPEEVRNAIMNETSAQLSEL